MPQADDTGTPLAPPALDDSLASRPELWSGPCWMLSASRPKQPAAMAVSGFRRHLADWEHHLEPDPVPGEPFNTAASHLHVRDPGSLIASRAWTSAELDIAVDTVDRSELATIVELVAGDDTTAALAALDAPAVVVNANRRIEVADSLRGAADLTVPWLPSRREDATTPLTFGHRRLRLIAGRTWQIAAWGPLAGRWEPEFVRWPHFAIPSRTGSWRSGAFGTHQTPVERLVSSMTDLTEHIEYQLGTWTVEHELWEQVLFTALADGEATFEGIELDHARQELSQFAEFLGHIRQAQRGLTRRPQVDPFLAAPAVRKVCHASAERIGERLDVRRDRVREAFALLADLAAGEQAWAAEQQRAATDRLQHTITIVTAALLVPALVVSIYGANIRELSSGARGDLPTLISLMVTSSVLTTIAIRGSRSEPLITRSPVGNASAGAIGLVLTIVLVAGLAAGHLGGLGWCAALVGSGLVAVSGILGYLTQRNTTPEPSMAAAHQHHGP